MAEKCKKHDAQRTASALKHEVTWKNPMRKIVSWRYFKWPTKREEGEAREIHTEETAV